MSGVLRGYLDLWAWFFWPQKKVGGFFVRIADRINIWLIGDAIKCILYVPPLLLMGLYVALFSFAPPVSLYLLGAAVAAVLARTYARRFGGDDGPRPIIAGFLGELASMAGWASIGFIILSVVQVWLNWRSNVSAESFAALEIALVDATAAVRRLADIKNELIAIAGLLVFAFIFRTVKPLVAFGAARKSLSAVLAVIAAVTSFSFVVAQDTADRRQRVGGAIVASARTSLDSAVTDRKATAAMRWMTAELMTRPRSARGAMIEQMAALRAAADALCAREQTAFAQEYELALAASGVDASAEDAPKDYCHAPSVFARAMSGAIRVPIGDGGDAPAEAAWRRSVLSAEPPGVSEVINTGYLPRQDGPSLAELKSAETHIADAAHDSARARAVVREALVDGIAALGPEFRGIAGKVVDAFTGTLLATSSLHLENKLLSLWRQSTPSARVSDDVVHVRKAGVDDVHFVSFNEAYGVPGNRSPMMIADDIIAHAWTTLKPAGGAIAAATAAAAFHPKMRTKLAGDVPHVKIPRIRF